ncbi:OmpA family protein [Flavobacteriaceae bacterium Ap0902]|nr:OmpA family protein [Flavobacteriaceae bacterium Ap0902]
MKRIFLLVGLSGLVMTSCVSKKKYDDLQSQFDSVYQAQQSCNNELTKCNAEVEGLRSRLESDAQNVRSLQNALDQCLNAQSSGNVNITKLIEQIDSSNKYIKQLINSKNKSDSLSQVLTNNLTRSLSRDEMEDVNIQVQKAVVFISLSDNMLYRSGSYEISDRANEVLGKIAKIIKDYPTYDVMVEGNTDNVPISRENIRNNWDLSALRASSVVMALQNKHGVDPSRMTAGGRGEYNTVTTNATPQGRAKNRRTEIIILPNLDQFMDLIGQAPEEAVQ